MAASVEQEEGYGAALVREKAGYEARAAVEAEQGNEEAAKKYKARAKEVDAELERLARAAKGGGKPAAESGGKPAGEQS